MSELWYTRREHDIRGPFPRALISRYILLGRIRDTDLLSMDRVLWQTYHQLPELIPDVMRSVVTEEDRERLRLARAREDERLYDKRDTGHEPPPEVAERRQGERRSREAPTVVAHRANKAKWYFEARREGGRRFLWPAVLGVVLTAAFVGFAFWYQVPTEPGRARNCSAPATPGVNWSYCQMEGADLSGAQLAHAILNNLQLAHARLGQADLRGSDLDFSNLNATSFRSADLSGASLRGANLRHADLEQANLQQANLSFANLSGARLAGARLTGAVLDKAQWTDGRTCASGSVGICR